MIEIKQVLTYRTFILLPANCMKLWFICRKPLLLKLLKILKLLELLFLLLLLVMIIVLPEAVHDVYKHREDSCAVVCSRNAIQCLKISKL